MSIREFIDKNYHHFNAGAVKDAAKAYTAHIDRGGKMMVTLAGAMSTAKLGISLAELIRQEKVHAISCTGANLEEDLFLLVAANDYVKVPDWRYHGPEDDYRLWEKHLNRVTDVCIPEAEAMRVLESALEDSWSRGDCLFPHEHLYRIIREGTLKDKYQNDPKESWMLAACEKNLPIYVPAFEDSTTGNMAAGRILLNKIPREAIKSGLDYMVHLMEWYRATSLESSIGMFQIGGGCAGDFPACVVPTLNQDFRGVFETVPFWGYHCQITDSTTSYGSFSGCTPSEKTSWGKLAKDTPSFVIESDATIVAPLIFSYVLDI